MLKLILIAFILCLSLKAISNDVTECGDAYDAWVNADYECLEFDNGYLYRSEFKDGETIINEIDQIDEEDFENNYDLVVEN